MPKITSINSVIRNELKSPMLACAMIEPSLQAFNNKVNITKLGKKIGITINSIKGGILETHTITDEFAHFHGIPLQGYIFSPQESAKKAVKKAFMLLSPEKFLVRTVEKNLEKGTMRITHSLNYAKNNMLYATSFKEVEKQFQVKNGKFTKFLGEKTLAIKDSHEGLGFKARLSDMQKWKEQNKVIKFINNLQKNKEKPTLKQLNAFEQSYKKTRKPNEQSLFVLEYILKLKLELKNLPNNNSSFLN